MLDKKTTIFAVCLTDIYMYNGAEVVAGESFRLETTKARLTMIHFSRRENVQI